ncbi:MAG: peptide deformylase [Alphaproteobacteria bacterium]|nr:peptide deformylase [Alphaproteobacteria bacterium]
MAIPSIIKAPDPILKKRCVAVEAVDDEIRTLMDDMLETMYAAPGVGLAAPQVAVHKRVIVVDTSRGDSDRSPIRMANPEIIEMSDDLAVYDEGCLSFPDQYAEVERPAKVRVRFIDYDNEIREMEAEELLSTCIQHEMDHLDGKLFVDHISMLKRNMILRKMSKLKKTGALK